MPDKSQVINKLILSAIIMLGMTIDHALAALLQIPSSKKFHRQKRQAKPHTACFSNPRAGVLFPMTPAPMKAKTTESRSPELAA